MSISSYAEHIARPRLRGTLHAVAAPVAALAGLLILLAVAETARERTGIAVWAITLTALFTVSAVYHRGRWRPAVRQWLQRVDHSMIFVFIAGTYTPFCLLVLQGSKSWLLLAITWGGAAAGVTIRLTWHTAPRWLFVPMYLGLGWVALGVLPDLAHSAPGAANWLLVAGGLLYTMGAIIFATRRPDPFPRVFGYHEAFHALTIAAATCHAAAIVLAAVHASAG